MKLILSILTTLGIVTVAWPSPRPDTSPDPFRPLRIATPIVVDGRLDDPAWGLAPTLKGFTTFHPDWGKPLSEWTEVLMAYDERFLYFAFRCSDREPEAVKASVTRRDEMFSDDWICVNLDTFGDRQGLYAFYVNPLGVQGDSRATATDEDRSFDAVWESAGVLTPDGYVVEMAIPLGSIRFTPGEEVRMGVFFERRISRRSEQGSYPPLDPAQAQAWLMQLHPMVYAGLRPARILEVLPSMTYTHRDRAEGGRLVADEHRGEAGITAKVGITQDLIFDGTVNPDFSQVEADAGQVDINLRYALFYPEKRPFFLEGSELFQITGTRDLIYTRTIASPIAGARVTGKLSGDQTVAALYALDEPAGEPGDPEPSRAHFGILRLKQGLGEDSFLGGIGAVRESRERGNRLGGFDGLLRIGKATTLSLQGIVSSVSEGGNASPLAHKYEVSCQAKEREVEWEVTTGRVSDGFAADMGYVPRTGIHYVGGEYTRILYPASAFFRRIDVGAVSMHALDLPSGRWESANDLGVRFLLGGTLTLLVRGGYDTEVFLGEVFNVSGLNIRCGGQLTKELYASLSGVLSRGIYYSAAPFGGKLRSSALTIRYQPWETVTGEYSLSYSDFHGGDPDGLVYSYAISRCKGTYQPSRYLLFRGILEYNSFRKRLLTDLLLSFTYIPGTVLHAGYGSVLERIRWESDRYVPAERFAETARGFFFKASYLWRV